MKRVLLFVVAAALSLAVILPLAGPAYAWGGYPQNPYTYSYGNGYTYPYQYANRYPYGYQYGYANPYQYPYRYQYAAPYQVPPPPPPPQPVYVIPSPPIYYYTPGLSTGFGDYGRCAQYGLHQASCFVPNSANSPNLGSIQMEPAIRIWGNCTAGQTMSVSGATYQCSKTGAGWFPQ